MAILSQSFTSWMLAVKVVLLSTGVLCTAVMLKLSVPVVMEFAFSDVPSIWSVLVAWLRPPYLYVVINFIIITIVASSKLQQKVVDESPQETVVQPSPFKVVSVDYASAYDVVAEKNASAADARPEFPYGYGANDVKEFDLDVYEHVDVAATEVETKTKAMLAPTAANEISGQDHQLALSRSVPTPSLKSTEYSVPSYEKPPVSLRIGHRKVVKSSPEGGRTLRVSKPKRQETLESTWKTITEGRPMPLTRHLRKSDTWETHGRPSHSEEHNDQRVTKSETFNDRTTTAGGYSGKLRREPSLGSGKLKKEPSLSQDDLNRRVEAFIKKFNEDMRLQRQESLNQYMEMINRGAH